MQAHGVEEIKLLTMMAGSKTDGKARPTLCVVGLLLFAGLSHPAQSECKYYIKKICANPCISIYYIYQLIRRPRLILDFALTLVFNHLVLTTYYSASLP
jgi:hypothetical protein